MSNFIQRMKDKRVMYEDMGAAKKIDRSKPEGLLEKLKILKKKKEKEKAMRTEI